MGKKVNRTKQAAKQVPKEQKKDARPKQSTAHKQSGRIVIPISSNDDIFQESSSLRQDEYQPKRSKRLQNSPVIKMEEEELSEADEWKPCLHHAQPDFKIKKGSLNTGGSNILEAKQFKLVDEVNFKIFGQMLARTKVYSLMLITSDGRIIYSDKLGHQLFEGSLNNFQTMRIQNLLLSTQKETFLDVMKKIVTYNQHTILKWLIYSKNSKRRYCRIPFEKQEEDQDTFYRFLKSLCLRVRPVRLHFRNYKEIEGFWNPQLIANGIDFCCFLLEVRLSSSSPNLSLCSLREDPLLRKYIESNRAKAALWATKSCTQMDVIELNKKKREEKEDEESWSELYGGEKLDAQGKERRRQQNSGEFLWKLEMSDC